MIPALFSSLKTALIPLLDNSTYVAMRAATASVAARGGGRSGVRESLSNKHDKESNREEYETKTSSVNKGNILKNEKSTRKTEPDSINITESSSCRPSCTIA